MTPHEFWWLIDVQYPAKVWGKRWKYTEAQMQDQYEAMLVEHERIYGRHSPDR